MQEAEYARNQVSERVLLHIMILASTGIPHWVGGIDIQYVVHFYPSTDVQIVNEGPQSLNL